MNFPFNINSFLQDQISRIDSNIEICKQVGRDRYGFQEVKRMLFEVVDKMGEASAEAQKLPSTITTGQRLQSSNHHLYIMKDTTGDTSSVVGLLKVGTKKLFIYDSCKIQHELTPLCVLDFYVHESRQRMGCGKKLFDFMLQSENIQVEHLAVDRPSPKFLSFLKKHYHLYAHIPQVNNFVVFDGFFQRKKAVQNYRSNFNINVPSTNRAQHNSGRSSQTSSTPQNLQQRNYGNYSTTHSQCGKRQSPHYMAAGEKMYSRHGATPSHTRASPSPFTKDLSRNFSPIDNSAPNVKKITEQSPLALDCSNFSSNSNNATSDNLNNKYQDKNSFKNGKHPVDINFNNTTSSPSMQFEMGTGVSHHKRNDTKFAGNCWVQMERKDELHPFGSKSNGQSETDGNGFAMDGNLLPILLPDLKSAGSSNPSRQNSSVQHPPSGKRERRCSYPPVLQRDGPPPEYKAMLNLHQNYQGRNGRFVVASESKLQNGAVNSPMRPPVNEPRYGANNSNNPAWNWSMPGYLREQRMKQSMSTKYNPSRLW